MKYFTVGPVEMQKNILEIGAEQTPYFRNAYFSEIMFEIDCNLKSILGMGEEDINIVLTASGTGAMDATVLNCLSKEDKVLIVSGGGFGERFEQICDIYGIYYDVIRIPYGTPFEKQMLSPYREKGYTAMLVNIHETSIGQLYPIEILSDFCRANNILFIVDAISSLFADPIHFTENRIDALIFSSHKALALPPGISVVSLSKRMAERLNQSPASFYFDFQSYIKNGLRGQTPFTPAIGILMQMHEALREIRQKGIGDKIAETKRLADDFRTKCSREGFEIPVYPLSNAMTPVLFESNAKYYYEKLIADYQITVNPNGGEVSDRMLRVGHMGNLTVEDNDILIEALCAIRRSIADEKSN